MPQYLPRTEALRRLHNYKNELQQLRRHYPKPSDANYRKLTNRIAQIKRNIDICLTIINRTQEGSHAQPPALEPTAPLSHT